MIINNIKLILLVLVLSLMQFIFNNVTNIYIDLIGILLVICLIYNTVNMTYLVSIAIFADLFGYWYIGEHLVAMMIVGVLTSKLAHFFRMSNYFLKLVLIEITFGLMSLILLCLNKIFNQQVYMLSNYLIEMFIFIPVIQFLYEKFVPEKVREVIWYD